MFSRLFVYCFPWSEKTAVHGGAVLHEQMYDCISEVWMSSRRNRRGGRSHTDRGAGNCSAKDSVHIVLLMSRLNVNVAGALEDLFSHSLRP